MRIKKRLFAAFLVVAMLLGQMPVAFATGPEEQFTGLTPGSTYYFDLSAQVIPGTMNTDLPDTSLHWVPFTYAGTVNAYSLDEASIDDPAASSAAGISPSDRSLFVAEHHVKSHVSWDSLHTGNLIFGKPYTSGGVDYSLRVLSAGNASNEADAFVDQRGLPATNEWDTILDKASTYIKNPAGGVCAGQDSVLDGGQNRRVARGAGEIRRWAHTLPGSAQHSNLYRPALEITSTPGTPLKTVTFDMNGNGTLGDGTLTSATLVYTGTLTLPMLTDAGIHYTGLSGGKNVAGWFDGDGNYYAQGASLANLPTGTTLKASYGVAPTITTAAAFPTGRVGEPYSLTLTASGGIPTTWSASDLPNGLSLNAGTGVISGTPTTIAMGSGFTSDITATNRFGSENKVYTLAIQPAYTYSMSVNKHTVDFGSAEVGYSPVDQQHIPLMNAGTGELTMVSAELDHDAASAFNIVAPNGTIAAGETTTVIVQPKSALAAGTYTGTLNITADHDVSAVVNLSFTVMPVSVAPSVITPTQVNGTVGVPYSDYLMASGTTPITWSISAGSLPDGLTLNGVTGYITGTPTTAGVFSFTVKATNSAGSDERPLTTTIIDPDIATVTAAQTKVENAVYSNMTQAAATSEAAIVDALKATAAAAVNDGTVTVSINSVGAGHTAPIAGDADHPDGTNSSFTFYVHVAKGIQGRDSTNKTITITATPFTGLTNAQAVAAAKTALVSGTVSVANGTTQAGKTAAVQTYVNALLTGNATGVTAAVTYNTGTGKYDIALSKGSANDSMSLTMTVNEAIGPYIVTESLTPGVKNVAYSDYILVNGTAPFAGEITAGRLPAGLSLGTDSGDGRLDITGTPTEAGSFTFTVKAENITSNSNRQLTLTVTDENKPIADSAFTAVNGAAYPAPFAQASAGDAAALAAVMKNIADAAVTAAGLSDIIVTINQEYYKAPTAGTADSPDGTDGRYDFTVTVKKGIWESTTTVKIITITATPFSGVSNANAVAAAKAALVSGTVSVANGATQADKTAAVQTYVNALLTGNATGVTAAVTYNTGTGKYDVALSKGSASDSKSLTMMVNEASADYTVTFSLNGGTRTGGGALIQTVTHGGSATAPIVTRSGYTFTGWDKAFSNVTSALAVTAVWSQNSSGTGGGTAAPTYEAKVTGGDGSIKTAVTVNAKTGSASTELSSAQLKNGKAFVVTMPEISGVTDYALKLPMSNLSETSGSSITLNTGAGSVTLPSNMLAGTQISGEKAQLTISAVKTAELPEAARSAVGNHPIVSLTLTADDKTASWNNPNAPVTVSIPYTPTAEELQNPAGITVYYIDGSGNLTQVSGARYDAKSGAVVFETTHFSYYAVGYVKVQFSDVLPDAWYYDAVRFIAEKGVTTGTSATTFSPDAALTRGQFVTLLLRAYGIEADANPTGNFSDAGDTYYTGYLAAAKRLGISGGVGDNRFAPEKAVTRQEMFTMLYKALKMIGKLPEGASGKTLSGFTDSGSVASYAQEAMSFLVQTGAVSGDDGRLHPTAATTRAEFAQVLYQLMQK